MSILNFFGLGKKPANAPAPHDLNANVYAHPHERIVDGAVVEQYVEAIPPEPDTTPPASMIGPAAELDRAIMGAMASRADPGAGITCQEIETLTGRSHQSVSANLRHLVEDGLVEPTGAFGVTQSGRRAMTWRPSARALNGREMAVAA